MSLQTELTSPANDTLETNVAQMWRSVPAQSFENAPSSVGLFEQEEIPIVGHELARLTSGKINKLFLLGCGPCSREEVVFDVARYFTRDNFDKDQLSIRNVTAVDLAQQFLDRASERLNTLKNIGVIESVTTECASIDDISLSATGKGTVILGVYDLACLLNCAFDGTEPVGFEEYAGDMAEFLGTETVLKPLNVVNGQIQEGAPIACYRSNDTRFALGFDGLRSFLQDNIQGINSLVGLRVQISRPEDPKRTFISTWFDIPNLAAYLETRQLKTTIARAYNAKKGAVLVLESPLSENQSVYGNVTLLMNNVLGNLGSDRIFNQVVDSLSRFCVGKGPI